MSHPLDDINLTELVQMARSAGIGNIGRQTPHTELIEVIEGADAVPCVLEPQRVRMESHIQKHFRSLRTQLPCREGKCSSFGCPDIIVQRCWDGFKEHIL